MGGYSYSVKTTEKARKVQVSKNKIELVSDLSWGDQIVDEYKIEVIKDKYGLYALGAWFNSKSPLNRSICYFQRK